MIDVSAGTPPPEVASQRRRRRPWVFAGLVVVLLAAAIPTAIWFAHWRGDLHPLADYPIAGAKVPVAAGRTLYFGDMADPARVFSHPRDPGTLTVQISDVHAVVRHNTAGASVTVEKCVLRHFGHYVLGVGAHTVDEQCSSLTPLTSGTVTLGYDKGDIDIVVAIRPAHTGTVDVHGVEIAFTSGWRHGAQHAGVQAETTTR